MKTVYLPYGNHKIIAVNGEITRMSNNAIAIQQNTVLTIPLTLAKLDRKQRIQKHKQNKVAKESENKKSKRISHPAEPNARIMHPEAKLNITAFMIASGIKNTTFLEYTKKAEIDKGRKITASPPTIDIRDWINICIHESLPGIYLAAKQPNRTPRVHPVSKRSRHKNERLLPKFIQNDFIRNVTLLRKVRTNS